MINLEIVKSAIMPMPSYADQVAIATAMGREWSAARAAIQACDDQCQLLGERRQALITAAVTGQIDVTTARGITS
ncbi:MAG: restriction endonuclease subunit S [Pseudonocardia sp.]